MITFNNDFEKSAYMERLAFDNFRTLYNLFNDDNVIKTDYTGNDVYDVLVTKHNDGLIYKRYIIELKIRDKAYENYVFETHKYRDLQKIKKIDSDNNEIIYINFTPDGTYVWSIDKIIHKYNPVKMEMNKATMNSRSDKEEKSIYLLLPSDAKKYEYRWDLGQFNDKIEQEKQKQLKIKLKLKEEDAMWNYLIGKK